MPSTLFACPPLATATVMALAACPFGGTACAQQAAPAAPTEATAPASTAMTTPSMSGPLVANPNPWSFEDAFGDKIYLSGVISGLGMVQSNPVPPDKLGRADLSNGQFMLQKTEGLFQFYLQVGGYAIPALAAPYISVKRGTGDFFDPVPVPYGKLAPTDEFSFQFGKLPTLIGAEYTFTFQNMNIERGLLWNRLR
jgi:Putative beta-barrel porin-2, OmpL-like. bbp2